MIQTRAAQMISDTFLADDNERTYFDSFPWHPGRNVPMTSYQRGYLGRILPTIDEIREDYLTAIIPGR